MNPTIRASLQEAQETLRAYLRDQTALSRVEEFAARLTETFRGGGKVLACGNGGSMSDAMLFAEEWTGRYRSARVPLPAIAISDPGHLSCVANDFGYTEVFARQIQALGKSGDLLLLLSTSGNSPNLLRAAEEGRLIGLEIVGLLGKGGGRLKDLCTIPIVVPGGTSDRIQELHIKIIHAVIEAVERTLFPELY